MCYQSRCFTAYLLFVFGLTIVSAGYAAEISIIAVGDITIGSGLTPFIEKHDVDALFVGTAELIKSADIALTTLNTSISDRGEPQYGVEHPFRALPALARGLANAGFKAVSLATPHIMDFGIEALEDTISLLNWYQVKTAGARIIPKAADGQNGEIDEAAESEQSPEVPQEVPDAKRERDKIIQSKLVTEVTYEPAWLDVKGAKVAFLAYSHGESLGFDAEQIIARAVYSEMIESVKKVAKEADLVVVSIHWGKAQNTQTVSQRQRFFAQGLIDAGADLVLCQRLHTLQGIEIYNEKPIIYSLADFIYETYDKQYSKVVIPKVTFLGSALKSIELTPLWVDNPDAKYQPQVLSGKAAQEALVNYQKLCAEFSTEVTIKGERGWIKREVKEAEKVQINEKELF